MKTSDLKVCKIYHWICHHLR